MTKCARDDVVATLSPTSTSGPSFCDGILFKTQHLSFMDAIEGAPTDLTWLKNTSVSCAGNKELTRRAHLENPSRAKQRTIFEKWTSCTWYTFGADLARARCGDLALHFEKTYR